jgi:uncharacterized protein
MFKKSSMKAISYRLDFVYVGKSRKYGRGIFTEKPIKAGTIIETAPVIVMNPKERKLIDQTLMHDYIFEWGDDRKECCMALGYVPLYNHAYISNCEYEMEFKKQLITVKAVRDIEAGEQLFINYNGEPNNDTPVWFDMG